MYERSFLKILVISAGAIAFSYIKGDISLPSLVKRAESFSDEDIATKLSEKYGVDIKAGKPAEPDLMSENIVDGILKGELRVDIFEAGARTEYLTTYYREQKDDLLNGGKEDIISSYDTAINVEGNVPAWVYELSENNPVSVIFTVNKIEDDKNPTVFVGLRPGQIGMPLLCNPTFGCDKNEAITFFEKELGSTEYFSGSLPK